MGADEVVALRIGNARSLRQVIEAGDDLIQKPAAICFGNWTLFIARHGSGSYLAL
ncbi:hypothetical protein M527_29145 [Sphingobium indicum IP26]|nr:hypothetical protein M527_29145 [Sphingobium indicum IP26]